MSTKNGAEDKSSGEFALPDQLLAERLRTFIGERAVLEVGPRSSISQFDGFVRGQRNSIQVESEAVIAGLRLEIDGDDNLVTVATGARLKNCRIQIHADTEAGNFRGHKNTVFIGELSSFANTVIDFKGSENSLQVGEKVYVLMEAELFLDGYGCSIRIGARTSIQSAVFSANELDTLIEIGEDNMISPMAVFSTGDGHPVFKSNTFERLNSAKEIRIGRHVWFAANARVMKGARIGDNCVVGYGSLVNRPLNDEAGILVSHALIAGVPAQVRRTGLNWSRQLFYEQDGDRDYEQKYPDACSQSWFHRGHLWLREGDILMVGHRLLEAYAAYLKGSEAYHPAIRLKPDYVYAYSELGMAHLYLGQAELSMVKREAALGQFKESARQLRSGLSYDPDHADSLYVLARVEKIIRSLEGATTDQGDEWLNLGAIIVALRHFGRIEFHLDRRGKARHFWDLALSNVEQFLQRNPEDPAAISERSKLLIDLAKIRKASSP